MPSWLPAVAYPLAQGGYWDPITSTINWCEEDYYATIYSAEIVNTLTNLLFIFLAYKGIKSCIVQGHDQIFLVSFVGYLLVGSGSFLFHSTLKYPMQLVDELSMIYTTCLMFYATFSYSRTRIFSLYLALGLVSLAAFITLYYHYLQDPAFHQNAYAILTAIVLSRSMYIMEMNLRPSWNRGARNSKVKRKQSLTTDERDMSQVKDQRDQEILQKMWAMIGCGLGMFLLGFVVWSLDNQYCSKLRVWRRSVGLPWGIVLEGHGWWHLLTGTGAYFYITWGIWLRHCLNGLQEEYVLDWPSMISIPEIVRASNLEGRTSNHRALKVS